MVNSLVLVNLLREVTVLIQRSLTFHKTLHINQSQLCPQTDKRYTLSPVTQIFGSKLFLGLFSGFSFEWRNYRRHFCVHFFPSEAAHTSGIEVTRVNCTLQSSEAPHWNSYSS